MEIQVWGQRNVVISHLQEKTLSICFQTPKGKLIPQGPLLSRDDLKNRRDLISPKEVSIMPAPSLPSRPRTLSNCPTRPSQYREVFPTESQRARFLNKSAQVPRHVCCVRRRRPRSGLPELDRPYESGQTPKSQTGDDVFHCSSPSILKSIPLSPVT